MWQGLIHHLVLALVSRPAAHELEQWPISLLPDREPANALAWLAE